MSILSRMTIFVIASVILVETLLLLFALTVYRQQVVGERIDRGALAARAILTNPDPNIDELQSQALLEDAEILDLVILRQGRRERLLIPIQQYRIAYIQDMTKPNWFRNLKSSLECFIPHEPYLFLARGALRSDIEAVETIVSSTVICEKQSRFLLNALPPLAAIALVLAATLGILMRIFVIAPIQSIGRLIHNYDADHPEKFIIEERSSIKEFRTVERALTQMQTRINHSIKQKSTLATIGASVAKIQHDLRNILSTAQMVADSLEDSQDPKVRRSAPRLFRAIDRAVDLTTQTLEYGRIGQISPKNSDQLLHPICKEVIEGEREQAKGGIVDFSLDVPKTMRATFDPSLLKRILENLARNARQILEETQGGHVKIRAVETEENVSLFIEDNGPGFSKIAQENLFVAFKGSTRTGGTGLGLVICAELAALIGGTLVLQSTNAGGTVFRIDLKKSAQ